MIVMSRGKLSIVTSLGFDYTCTEDIVFVVNASESLPNQRIKDRESELVSKNGCRSKIN
jgi:hypothetical protein